MHNRPIPVRGANRLLRLAGIGPAPAGVPFAGVRTRAAPGLRPGVLRPPARSSLTVVGSAGRVGPPLHPWRVAATKGRKARQELSRKRGPGAARRTPSRRAEGRHAGRKARVNRRTGCAARRAVPLAFSARHRGRRACPGPDKKYGRRSVGFFPARRHARKRRSAFRTNSPPDHERKIQ
jgi:hypothetical protein